MSNFIEDCINGYALTSEVDDYIEQWHDGDSQLELHDFLGMTLSEYALFVQDEIYLPIIVTAHKTDKKIATLMKEELKMVARSDDPTKSRQLQEWLDNQKLWE